MGLTKTVSEIVYYTMAVESMRLPNAKFAARGEAECRNGMR